MRILALDLSLTATGWALTTELRWRCGTIQPRSRGVVRLQEVLDEVSKLSSGSDLVVIEGYAFSSRQSHSHGLGELGGVIRLFLHQKGIPFAVLPPATVKKLATGAGNARKEVVLLEAWKRLEYDGADNNEADALWLLQAALIHYEQPGAVPLPAKHLEAMKKVEWPKVAQPA